MIKEIILAFIVVLGTLLILLAALGILRFPDLYSRMHAASKSSSLGTGLILLAGIIYFWSFSFILKTLAVIIFIFLTIPIASHVIGKTAYSRKVKLYKGTCIDEMEKNN